ncbi:MAG: TPM domain-containing protein [bacterium]
MTPKMRAAFFCFLALLVFFPSFVSAETIPPSPPKYFNDFASVVSSTTAGKLNQELEQFERETSNQLIVVIYPTMQSESSIEDYTVRVAQRWRVGQKAKDNGVVLFVFVQDRRMYIQVGYGLEGALPDVICKRIIENELKPRFRNGDFDGGLTAGVHAIMQATKGEYKGTGRLHQSRSKGINWWVVPIFFVIVFIQFLFGKKGRVYSSSHPGGVWSTGGWSSGGGGGFSGGCGSFGGGGAGGSW